MSKKLNFWIGLSPLLSSLGLALFIITSFKLLPAKMPLFYSLPWGDKQLATHNQFLILPASIALATLVNLILSWQLHPSQSFFKKTLFYSSLIVSLILTIAFVKIVLMFT